jgi:YHS domain-containing protein
MKKILINLLMLFVASTVFAAEPVSKSDPGSVAIGGIDTTAYHLQKVREEHKAVMGNSEFTVEWNAAKWHFASQQSADKFTSDPERYRPQYNGFCSNALSLGRRLVKTDGTVWEFFGDDLHLFYAEKGRQRWLNGDWKTYKQEANKSWAVLSKQQ